MPTCIAHFIDIEMEKKIHTIIKDFVRIWNHTFGKKYEVIECWESERELERV